MSTKQSDVLIVGAGPAGLASAIQLKQRGVARVIVVDREPEAGGMPRLCHHTGFGIWDFHRLYTGPQYARRYVAQAQAAGVEILTSTTVIGWEEANVLTTTSPQGMGGIRAQAILLATGVRERPRSAHLVPGFRPRGIFTTGSLQRFVDERHLPVGQRAVIVGAEGVSLSALMTLTGAGVEVAAMLTDLPRHQMYFPYSPAKWWLMDASQHIPIHTSTRIKRILGHKRVSGVEIEDAAGQTRVLSCDTVVFTGSWIPENEVARKGPLQINRGTLGPQIDPLFRTTTPGVFAAGNLLRGAETAATSAREGRLAAQHITDFLQGQLWPTRQLAIQPQAPITWVFPNSVAEDAAATQLQHLSFRVSQFMGNATVLVRQGKILLHSQTFKHLLPNETMRLRAHWLDNVNLSGEPLQISVE